MLRVRSWGLRLLSLVTLVLAMLWPSFAVAQSGSAPTSASGTPVDFMCLGLGGLIAIAVTFLKGVPFIARNPKWVSLICSLIVAGAQSWYHGAIPSAAVLASCVLTQLAGAVATHEVVVKPVQNVVAFGS